MRRRLFWLTPAAIVGSAVPGYAITYLSVGQAQQAIFPGAAMVAAPVALTDAQRSAIEKESGVRVRSREVRVWKVAGGGFFIVDQVVGKHEFITFAVGLTAEGAVKQVEIMDYRETYGAEVRNPGWRAQFVGKTRASKVKLGKDIENISGATLSCRHVTDGLRRLLAFYDVALR